jgi:hypothetical protein
VAKYDKSESYSIEFEEVVRKRKMIREYEFDRPIPDYIIAKLKEKWLSLTSMLRAIRNQLKD